MTDRVQAIADELLRHDIDGNNTHTCLCGEALWTNGNHEGNTSMARHRAVNIVRVLDEFEAKQDTDHMGWDAMLSGLEAIAMSDLMPMGLGADLLQLHDEIKGRLGK